MALYKPTKSSNSGVNYYGICDIAILGFEDKSSQFEWADIYLDVTIKQKGSDYTKSIRLNGYLEKEPDGSIKGGSVINRLYHFFDVLGVKAGINAKGDWETADGQPIKDIAKYLTDNHAVGLKTEPTDFPYLAYVYREKPKQPGGKVFTRVHHKINANSVDGRKKLEDDMNWMRDKGYLKEAPMGVGPEGHNKVSVEEMERVFGDDAMSNM